MEWIPSWVAKSYARLYTDKDAAWFDFAGAKKVLGVENKKVVSRRLNELENAGFLISKKDQVDRRKRYYRLIEPNDVIFSYGIRLLSPSESVMDRLASVANRMEFVIGDSYAAYVYSGYASPGKMDIYVNEKEKDRWIALLSDKSASVSVDDMLSEHTAKQHLHIHSSLSKNMIKESIKIKGIRYAAPEVLVMDGFTDQSEFTLTDALAILITKRKELDFKKIVAEAKHQNVEREIGVCMEIINKESAEKIFDDAIINKLYSGADFSREKFFPRTKLEESKEYKRLSDKWKLKVTLSRAFISKIITDLIG